MKGGEQNGTVARTRLHFGRGVVRVGAPPCSRRAGVGTAGGIHYELRRWWWFVKRGATRLVSPQPLVWGVTHRARVGAGNPCLSLARVAGLIRLLWLELCPLVRQQLVLRTFCAVSTLFGSFQPLRQSFVPSLCCRCQTRRTS